MFKFSARWGDTKHYEDTVRYIEQGGTTLMIDAGSAEIARSRVIHEYGEGDWVNVERMSIERSSDTLEAAMQDCAQLSREHGRQFHVVWVEVVQKFVARDWPAAPALYERRVGFTLIELMVVIAIIGLMIGMLMPVLASSRETARSMQCSTQIRGQVQAVHSYAQEFDGRLPPGYWTGDPNFGGALRAGETDWVTTLHWYMHGIKPAPFAPGNSFVSLDFEDGAGDRVHSRLDATWTCPSASHKTAGGFIGNSHYSTNPILMPSLQDFQQHKMQWVVKASEKVLIGDGNQHPASATAYASARQSDNNGMIFSSNRWNTTLGVADNDDPVRIKFNSDGAAWHDWRWRHHNDSSANFGYVDGHVGPSVMTVQPGGGTMGESDLLKKNVRVDMAKDITR